MLQSPLDDISEKSGVELMKEKVSEIWIMAGKWDEEGVVENNFVRNRRAREAAENVCRLCPVPITFCGFEVGVDVITGDELDENDYLYRGMLEHGSRHRRNSCDPMLVELAITEDGAVPRYDVVKGTASVDRITDVNCFEKTDTGNHQFVVRKYPIDCYKKKINILIEL